MKQMMTCDYCGERYINALKEYNRLVKEYPDKWIRKEEDEGFSTKVQNLGQMLEDREKRDKLYKEHLRKLAFGTSEEKALETKRIFSGYYERHTGPSVKKIIL